MLFDIMPTFDFFQYALEQPDLRKQTILDFGGNRGNLIVSSKGLISPQLYWCLDVDLEAVTYGKSHYPSGNWTYYNRYNPCYNPKGNKVLIPNFGIKFNFIFSYSVFTHMSETEFLSDIRYLYHSYLEENGELCFSFLEPKSHVIEWFLKKRIISGAVIDITEKQKWVSKNNKGSFIMIDDGDFSADTELHPISCQKLLTFYDQAYLVELLGEYRPKYKEPYGDYLQSFIVIKKGGR